MMTFRTKSETLKVLETIIKKAKILPQYSFTLAQLNFEMERIHAEAISFANGKNVIVRSSSLKEDSKEQSLAGKYLSVLDVRPEKIPQAIQEVKQSFEEGDESENIIFIQPMLKDVLCSGVVFTVDPNTLGNYYVVNYDESGSTESVTSGEGRNLKLYYQFKGSVCREERLAPIIEMAKELEMLFQHFALDIEFAVNSQKELYLLQVRPLVIKGSAQNIDEQQRVLDRIAEKVHGSMKKMPFLYGNKTIYSVMSDWNPAEMIGIHPHPLAKSLYKRLITDSTWAYQRDNYGYKNLRSFPLMLDFNGFPYIDTRVSFNSFIPKELGDELSTKLADFYLDFLARFPEKHDKVEFDIINSCYTFDMETRVGVLEQAGFSEEEVRELKEALRKQTNCIINQTNGLWISESRRLKILNKRRDEILDSDLDIVEKIYWLLEDGARYGTLPFAGLARAGFIAVQLLRSLVNIKILSENDYQKYMNSLDTISSQMSHDRYGLSREKFLSQYGHLRPGTYEITTERYDVNPECYFGSEDEWWKEEGEWKKTEFSLTIRQLEQITAKMKEIGIEGDVLALFRFIKAGIEGREYAKYLFTKNLSDALELFAKLGGEYGFSREELSFADIAIINEMYSGTPDIENLIKNSIEQGKKEYNQSKHLILPPVILKEEDVYGFYMLSGHANFITLNKETAEVISGNLQGQDLKGKIVLIRAADPGYDWIFSHQIAGFITAYGGANSHMAIRAGELDIPAVIGVGEPTFKRYERAKRLCIDCPNKKVDIVS